MNDDQKLQLIRLKVEELQGLSGRRQAAGDRTLLPGEVTDAPDTQPDDDNLVDDDFSVNLSGRKSRRRRQRAEASGPSAESGAAQSAEGMGDVSVGVANSSMAPVLGFIGLASMGLSAYHGYRRNDSLGWGIAWGVLGAVFPVITPAIALAQGFGKPIGKTKSNAGSDDCPECGGDLGEGLDCDTCDVYAEDGVDEFLVEQAALQA